MSVAMFLFQSVVEISEGLLVLVIDRESLADTPSGSSEEEK
jgi:hypothetical protein